MNVVCSHKMNIVFYLTVDILYSFEVVENQNFVIKETDIAVVGNK